MKILAIILACSLSASAQLWTGVIAPARAVDWSGAGAVIPNRTAICTTLSAPQTGAQINTAISNCAAAHPSDAGGIVVLNAGTYTLGAVGASFVNKSNVTLRGGGADQTFLIISNNANCYFQAAVCMEGSNSGFGKAGDTAPDNTASIAGSPARGATSITLTAIHGSLGTLAVGSPMVIDQCLSGRSGNTNASGFLGCTGGAQADNGEAYECAETNANCSSLDGPSGVERPLRIMGQVVTVTNIAGNVITFTPGLYMPTWSSARSPEAFWTSQPVFSDAVENLSIDFTALGVGTDIMIHGCLNCWVKGVRSVYATRTNSERNHVMLLISAHATIRDSYFFGSASLHSEGYGVEFAGTSDDLVENNIFQGMPSPQMQNSYASGSVIGYNYSINDANDASFLFNSLTHHGPGDFILAEGNIGNSFRGDKFHGSHNFNTQFRNYWNGWETTIVNGLQPYFDDGISRYFNAIGNVLGRTGTQSNYQCTPSACPAGFNIYELGTQTNDTLTVNSQMRWGNYDTVTATVRFQNSEVPSAFNDTTGSPSLYVNPVPASQTLPASFYYASKPAWVPISKAWPLIGPDVSGGNIAGVGGHANTIPAQDCATTIGIPADGSGTVRTFNAATCYSITGSPIVQLSPTSLDFGNRTVGTTSPSQVVTLTNIGNAQLTINSIVVAGDYLVIQTCGTTPVVLAINASCTFTTSFQPISSGARNGSITLNDDASDSPQTVPLTGVGTTGLAKIQGNIVVQGNIVIK